MNNMRRNRIIEYKGTKKTVSEFAKEFNLSPRVVSGRLHSGWDIEKALTTPKMRGGKS